MDSAAAAEALVLGCANERRVRIHGPTVLIEYDSIVPPDTRFPADFDHIHTVTRVPGNDFGEDWLRRHHLEHHQKA